MLYVANEWGRSVYGFTEHSLPQALPVPVLQVAYFGIYKNGMTIVNVSVEKSTLVNKAIFNNIINKILVRFSKNTCGHILHGSFLQQSSTALGF